MAFPAALSPSTASLSSISSHPHSYFLPSHQNNCSFFSPSPCIYSNHTSHSKPYRRLTPSSQHCCFRVCIDSLLLPKARTTTMKKPRIAVSMKLVPFSTQGTTTSAMTSLSRFGAMLRYPPEELLLWHSTMRCGFRHLFNQNHRGAMMELGEGLCKLRKMSFKSGPFYQFEQEISAALDFIYRTQIELAACTKDLCVTMDQSERSYQLLGGYAAGQLLYTLQTDPNEAMYILFSSHISYDSEPPKVKLPTLNVTAEHLVACQYK